MTTRKKFTTIVLAVITLAVVSTSANATDYHHLDRLAIRMTKNCEALFREFRYHYRHTCEFNHLMSDVKELRSHALHIHEVAHHHGSLRHLAHDIREMDRLFHHLEDLVARVERRNSHSHGYHHSHIDGNTAHVFRLMRAIESDMHHLGEDVEHSVSVAPIYHRRVAPVVVPGRYVVPRRTIRVPVPTRPAYIPAVPSPHFRPHGTTSLPTPFGRLTIHH